MLGLRFASPWWLLGLLVVPLLFWHARRSLAGLSGFRRWSSLILRVVLVVATILALAEAYWRQESREVTTAYLLDFSDSLTGADREKALEYVRSTSDGRFRDGPRPDDCAGLTVFGSRASVEAAPREHFRPPQRIASVVDGGHTDIADGLRLAAASFPAGARKRVVLISDGAETKGLALEEARQLAELGVRVECVPVVRGGSPEVLVEHLAVRPEVRAGEPVEVRTSLRALQKASGTMHLYLDGRPVGERRFRTEKAGKLPPEIFTIRLPGPGFYPLELRLDPDAGCDTLPQNNVGYACTQVRGEASVLVLYSPQGEGKEKEPLVDVASLSKALASEKIAVNLAGPEAVPTSAAELAAYDCVIIANLGADNFTAEGMRAVQAAVRDMGVGLVMLGGVNGFGAGGYQNTPIEEALPVSCDVRQRKVMPKGALAVAIDCSGSMTGAKVAHAKAGAQAAADALSDEDYIAVLSFDTQVNWLVRPIAAKERARVRAGIASLGAGGGTHIYPALEEAWRALKPLDAAIKHIILLSDGQTTGGGYEDLARRIAADKITITSVGIGEPDGQPLMQAIARNGGGRFYYVGHDRMLPQIFIKEAVTVRRSVIFTEPFTPRLDSPIDPVRGFAGAELPRLGGYVVTTAKDRAETPLTVTLKDVTDPVLAQWHYGEGKAVAFTSTAAPDWAAEWISWPGYAKFWSQVVRWASRAGAGSDLAVTADVRSGVGKVIVEAMDDKGRLLNFLDLAGHAVDPRQQGQSFALAQTAPGRYEGEFEAGPAGSYVVNVAYKDAGGQVRHHSVGAACGYSPEFARFETNPDLLADVAKATGGRLLTGDSEKDRAHIWARDLPVGYRVHPGWKWLLWMALVFFPLDVAIRRVMIDWRRVGQALRAALGAIFPRMRPAVATGPDPTMAALVAEKERIRRAAPLPTADGVRERFVEQLARARAEQESIQGRAVPEASPVRTAPAATSVAGKKPEPPQDSGISTYTATLLEAKKRALKERQQAKEGSDRDRDGGS